MSHDADIDPATERVLAGIEDEDMAARYPNRAHFISADNPHQGEMATRALFDGDPERLRATLAQVLATAGVAVGARHSRLRISAASLGLCPILGV